MLGHRCTWWPSGRGVKLTGGCGRASRHRSRPHRDQVLRKKGVVEKFVEFYGTGLVS